MKTILLSVLLFAIVISAQARHFIYPGKGPDITLNSATLKAYGVNLKPADTLFIPKGVFAQLSVRGINGSASQWISIIFKPGAVLTTQGNVFDNYLTDCSFLRFENIQCTDYHSNFHRVTGSNHDLTWKNCSWQQNLAGYFFEMQDTARAYNGSKASTYYNFKWQHCVVSDLRDGAFVRAINNGQGQVLKNICLDFEFEDCRFDRFVSASIPSIPLSFDLAFGLKVTHCTFSNIGVVDKPVGHGAAILFGGYAYISQNLFGDNNFADDLRAFPLQLNLSGYHGPDAEIRCWNNISRNKRKYGMFEINQAHRDVLVPASNGQLDNTGAQIWNNTLFRSRRGDYVAPLVDVYASNITIANNLVIEPEAGSAFDSLANNYVFHLGTDKLQNLTVMSNRVFANISETGIIDSGNLKPGPRSRSIRDAADLPVWIKNDYAGQPNGYDIGAVQSGLPRVRSAPVKTKKKLLLPSLFGIIGGGVIMMLVIAKRRRSVPIL